MNFDSVPGKTIKVFCRTNFFLQTNERTDGLTAIAIPAYPTPLCCGGIRMNHLNVMVFWSLGPLTTTPMEPPSRTANT